MRIGAHVSTAGGLPKAIERALAWDAEAAQIFVSSPQSWKPSEIKPEIITEMAEARAKAKLPVFIHAIYLINLGSNNPYYQQASRDSLIHALTVGQQIGATAVITHLGSHKGEGFEAVLPRIVKAVQDILAATEGTGCQLLLENAAGSGNIIGDKLPELAEILHQVKNDRVGICFDTAHGYASGYDVASASGWKQALTEIANSVGLKTVRALHLNDTKIALGGRRDRHEPIGQGEISPEAFGRIINEPSLQHAVGLLETPDLDPKQAESPASLALLKSLRKA